MIGNFDGVHLGHRAVLMAGARRARASGLVPFVLTFEPHPYEVLSGIRHSPLTTMEYRVELVCQTDPALRVIVEPFTLALAAASPRQFAHRLLAEQLGARVVIVGQNFRFGAGRTGDLTVLSELGAQLGFEAHAEPLVGDVAGGFSSSRVRAALGEGDLSGAERILGRPHCVSGTVVAGDGRGRMLGVPTANLAGVVELLPPDGVYACLVDRIGASDPSNRSWPGVMNIGVRPTLGTGPRTVEVHLLDRSVDLYASRLRLFLLARLRGERAFSELAELRAQIAKDIARARDIIRPRLP